MKQEEYDKYDNAHANVSEVVCFHCKEIIAANQDYCEITQSKESFSVMWLYFHSHCYVSIAGIRYFLEET